jgi:hypothetical protein
MPPVVGLQQMALAVRAATPITSIHPRAFRQHSHRLLQIDPKLGGAGRGQEAARPTTIDQFRRPGQAVRQRLESGPGLRPLPWPS